jgi:ligand-binding sensor domain-containing protein
VDVATELSAVSTALEEIIRLQRLGLWEISLERLAQVRKALMRTKAATDHLSDEDQSKIQMAIQQVTSIRNSIDKALPDNASRLNAKTFNRVLNTRIDELTEVVTSIRASLTR